MLPQLAAAYVCREWSPLPYELQNGWKYYSKLKEDGAIIIIKLNVMGYFETVLKANSQNLFL